jgi:hypothetical protein
MLSSMLLDLIENNSRRMAKAWRLGITSTPFSKTYQRFGDAELEARARDVYENLGKWLDRDTTMDQIGEAYIAIGRKRYQEGFPLCEVQYGLYYTKKVLWDHILSEGILTSALEMLQALDLLLRLQNFFDLASFYIIRGWLQEMALKLEQSSTIAHENLNTFFPVGSFALEFDQKTC